VVGVVVVPPAKAMAQVNKPTRSAKNDFIVVRIYRGVSADGNPLKSCHPRLTVP
jgi:hypothetical protein